jgi:hypothetical protein
MPIYFIVTFLDIDIGKPSSVFLRTVPLNTKRLGGVNNLRANGAFAPLQILLQTGYGYKTNSVTCWTEDTNPWS